MHITAERLFDALKQVAGVDGRESPGAVAAFLKETPAVITNWKSRGISKAGQLKVHAMTGISPTWLATGEGEMLPAGDKAEGSNVAAMPVPTPRGLGGVLTELQTVVDGLSPLLQVAAKAVLRQWLDGQASLADVVTTIEGMQQISAGTMPAAVNRAA